MNILLAEAPNLRVNPEALPQPLNRKSQEHCNEPQA